MAANRAPKGVLGEAIGPGGRKLAVSLSASRPALKGDLVSDKRISMIQRKIARFGRLQARVAKDRDQLRDLLNDVETLVDDLDVADEGLDEAVRGIQDAIDRISQTV